MINHFHMKLAKKYLTQYGTLIKHMVIYTEPKIILNEHVENRLD